MNTTMCLFMFVSLILSGKILAREEVIATITNDENNEVYDFIARTDDKTDSITAFFKDDYLNGQKYNRKLLASENLNHGGVVLEKRNDYNVINLKSENFDLDLGGTVTIDTLYDGVNGKRKEYDVELSKTMDGKWKLFKGSAIISKLHIITNKRVLFGAVGVKEILMK